MARFAQVSCSNCGRNFGPGDNGFSHCEQHEAKAARADWWRELVMRGDPVTLTDDWRSFEAGYVAGVRAQRER